MSVLDWLLVISIGGYSLYVLLHKKKSGCCGDCETCDGCSRRK